MSTARPRDLALLIGVLLGCTARTSTDTSAPAAEPVQTTGAAPSQWSYEIELNPALTRMQVGLCIAGPWPDRLEAGPEAIDFLISARVRGGAELRRDGETLVLDEPGCIDLEIDLDAAAQTGGRDCVRRGDTLMVAPDRWLWHPHEVPVQLDARADIELPDGVSATLPWPQAPDGRRLLDRTSFGWNAWAAFGRYQPLELTAAEAQFEVAILTGDRQASDAGVEAWLRTAAESSAELHGRFPRERVAVVVVPMHGSWGHEPVLFGMARRGGGASVMLMLDDEATDEQLLGEWVATHELLHLGMPLIADAWMSEGFVTYYTTILRARQGVLEPAATHEQQIRAALQALHGGFDRAASRLLSIGQASDNIRAVGMYTLVYWGGAAIAFDIDRRLRAASDGQHSLDDLMRAIAPLAPERRRWPAADLLALMDREIALWRDAGQLDEEISVAAIAEHLLTGRGLPPSIKDLAGLAVETKRGQVRLLQDPIDQVQVRSELFEPFARHGRGSVDSDE